MVTYRKLRMIAESSLVYAILTLWAVVALTPFFWALSTSFKIPGKEFSMPIELLPRPFTLDNYRELFSNPILDFARIFANTLKVAIPTTLGVLLVCSLAGFAFAKLYFPGRDIIFMLLLGTMMIPMAVTLIPRYLLMKTLGWLNTFYPLIVPTILTDIYGTFLMRQFFISLPSELLDSARVDGCSPFYMYLLIALPLAKPALVTLLIITFMGSWNNFFGPLVYLTKPRLFTIQLGLSYLNSEYGVEWRLLMAGTVITIMPVIFIFLLLQRYYVQGIALSGIKG
ncbi:MAG: carbohydrate ABC transporter permease [bacterium]